MPLMREWTEIHVDEGLLVHVVQELLALAVNPNHVDVVYGATGRMILAEVHLADAWYLWRQSLEDEGKGAVEDGTEVHASGFEVVASENVDEATVASAKTVPAPAKRRGSVVTPSASPDGEEP